MVVNVDGVLIINDEVSRNVDIGLCGFERGFGELLRYCRVESRISLIWPVGFGPLVDRNPMCY